MDTPWYGSRQMARHLWQQGHIVGHHTVSRDHFENLIKYRGIFRHNILTHSKIENLAKNGLSVIARSVANRLHPSRISRR